jgi:hypothetical protein
MDLQTQNFQRLMAEQKRIAKNISVEVSVITPEHALKFLQKNLRSKSVINRKVDARTVNNYVKDILNDRWKVGQPLIFDTKDNLLDGQTRCTAIVKAQKSVLSLVVRGVDTDIFDILDCGKKRTPKDVLSTLIHNSKKLTKPAGVSAGIALLSGVDKNHKSLDKNRAYFTNPELFQLVKDDFDYYNEPFESGKINLWRKNINFAIAESVLTGFYYKYKKTHGDVVDTFISIITSSETDAPVVREFRDMMIENKGKKSDERGYLPPHHVYFLVDTLFAYSQDKQGLKSRKHFAKSDLQKLNE